MAKTFSSRKFYEILGVREDFSREELNAQFRKRVKNCHPDRFTDPQMKQAAQEKTQILTEAYDVLSDPGKRSYYDHWLSLNSEKQTRSTVESLEHYMPVETEPDLISNSLHLIYNGSPLEASVRLKMALARKPDFTAARFLLGIALLEIGGTKTREGHRIVKEALKEEPALGYLWKGTYRGPGIKFATKKK